MVRSPATYQHGRGVSMTEPIKLCMHCVHNVENGRWCKMYELRKREAREQCEGTYWERDPRGYA